MKIIHRGNRYDWPRAMFDSRDLSNEPRRWQASTDAVCTYRSLPFSTSILLSERTRAAEECLRVGSGNLMWRVGEPEMNGSDAHFSTYAHRGN